MNESKLNLSMREMKPVKIGGDLIYVDTVIYNALCGVLKDTNNTASETIEYIKNLKSQLTDIQEGLKML